MASKASLATSNTPNFNEQAWPSEMQTVSSGGMLLRAKKTSKAVLNHIIKHTGVGIVCAVAYFDP